MKPMYQFILTIVSLACVTVAKADVGPMSTVVIVNSDSQSSRTIAKEYAKLRGIPAENVIELNAIPNQETISVMQFRQLILRPLLAQLEDRKLRSRIDCVAYSSDFPTAINVRSDFDKLPRVLTPVASINGLTFLYQQVLEREKTEPKSPTTDSDEPFSYLSLNTNRYFSRPILPFEIVNLAQSDAARIAIVLRDTNNNPNDLEAWKKSGLLFEQLARKYPKSHIVQYNLACSLARQSRADEALAALEQAVKVGWFDRGHAEKDPDLKSLRDNPRFKSTLVAMQKNVYRSGPSKGFSSRTKFVTPVARNSSTDLKDRSNDEARRKSQGRSYLLSTVLGVTRGRGNTVEEVLSNLRRQAKADGSRPSGTIYLMRNSNVRSRTRDPLFPAVQAELEKLGVKAQIIAGTIPKKKNDVAGAVVGTAVFDWKKSESRILPGAICEHLTSFGGIMLAKAGQTPLTEFIRHGAAGSSGTVTEPYAIAAKFPSPFIHVHYVRGASLAEAFYQSIQGPYQLLIVGDPLCRPWADKQLTRE